MKKYKGLLVFVYKNPLGDCTAKGISHDKTQLILIGEGIPEIFEGDETNTVRLVKRNLGYNEPYLHVEPVNYDENNKPWFMAGGNFVYTSDSRFPNKYPISIHDRVEK
jgi:hypothetical protein